MSRIGASNRMKTLIVAIATICVVVALFQFNVLPWRIVSQQSLDELNNQIISLNQQLAAAKQVQAAATPSGAWMWDPNHKNALDTTPSSK